MAKHNATYPKLCDQDVSNAAQNCHTVKNIPGIFEIVLNKSKKTGSTKEDKDMGIK